MHSFFLPPKAGTCEPRPSKNRSPNQSEIASTQLYAETHQPRSTCDGSRSRSHALQLITYQLDLKRKENIKCHSSFVSHVLALRSGQFIISSSPIHARRVTVASLNGSATLIRCCRRTRPNA